MIKRCLILLNILIFGALGQVFANTPEPLEPLLKHRISTVLITKLVDEYHYKKTSLNDELSSQIFEEYLKTLDPNRNIFTQSDINEMSRYESAIDDALLEGDLQPAFKMFQKFNERRVERADFALKRLNESFDFSIDESYVFDREDMGWPADVKALDEIWRKRVKNDYLSLLLAGKKESDLKETLRKRYERYRLRSSQFNEEDAYEFFVNAYLRTLEPHTAYFSPRTSENFDINMSLSLEGIGAVLQTVDEYTVVRRIVKGGPADLSRLLHAGDKIIGVGQGTDEVDDVIGWRLDDVVDKIRGPKDTVVQLHILPEEAGHGGADKYISIVRNKIKLEDQKVKKSVIEIPDGEKARKIGVIEIPTFYMDFAASARGEKDYSSTTRDTKIIIDELKAENVDGIVVDLRRNGGGSLIEAVSLTGLFIKTGPVVQIRKSNGKVQLNEDEDEEIAYSGPLAVLVDKNSASASEIFAGAMQDYDRGVILGEPTFGKGTVQSVINLNNYIKGKDRNLGKLKITMAQFFRVNGGSTQHKGVIPDIIFPTAVEDDSQGERSLENALPWAEISAARFESSKQMPSSFENVIKRHKSRIKSDSGFEFAIAQAKLRQEIMERKEVSLLKSKRESERQQQKKDRNEQLNKFRVSRGLKAVSLAEDNKDDEDEIKNDEKNEKLTDELRLVSLKEAAAILADLNFSSGKLSNGQHIVLK